MNGREVEAAFGLIQVFEDAYRVIAPTGHTAPLSDPGKCAAMVKGFFDKG
ncbi:MAG: hypothetical protein U9R72_10515 [Chloroflexota bacterium]|nr:hypothetical protein [Chloroflexota bacterium]